MLRRSNANRALFMLAADMILADVALFVAATLRLGLPAGKPLPASYAPSNVVPLFLYLLVPAVWLAVSLTTSVYDGQRTQRVVDDLQRVVTASLFSSLILAGLVYLTSRDLPRLLFVYFVGLDLAFLVLWRASLRLVFLLGKGVWPRRAQRVAIVGAGPTGRRVGDMLKDHQWAGVDLIGYFDDAPPEDQDGAGEPVILGTLDDVVGAVRDLGIEELVIALPLRAHARLVELVSAVQRFPVRVHVVPDLFDLAFFRTTIQDLHGVPVIGLRDPVIDGFPRLAKRAFDIVLGAALLICAAPVMAVMALAIKLDSPGPVIYKQERVGENGRLFSMYKFRSMQQDADQQVAEVLVHNADGSLNHKRPDDPRITKVGRFIRRTSLDELPQLWNVLKGEMSLVGPRPEMPWLVEMYEPWQRKRFAVPQGITGWWQVNGRSDKPMHLHTEEDLYYIQNYSLLLDLRILWRTLGAVLKRNGAY